jgi:hypothetical protein
MGRPSTHGPIQTRRLIYAPSAGERRRTVAVARIGAPVADGDDWRCRVSCRTVLDRDTWIFGINADQARELAHDFAAQLLRRAGYLTRAPGLPETTLARQRRKLGG